MFDYIVLVPELEKHIQDMHVLITTPFHPAYVTAERINKAKNLELLLTAGIGSDHIDLPAAAAAGLTVAEVTGSNTVSVAEDELLRILILVRNFLPGHQQVVRGEWNVAGVAHGAYDLEGKTVGTVGAGRIGRLLLQRLKPFNCNLLYHDRLKIGPELEKQIGAKFEEDLDAMLPKCDVVVINTPLTEKTRFVFFNHHTLNCVCPFQNLIFSTYDFTEFWSFVRSFVRSFRGMFNKERIAKMKKGVVIVNNARGAIMDTQAVADACSSGHVAGTCVVHSFISSAFIHTLHMFA
jgi:formate dehydrogenase